MLKEIVVLFKLQSHSQIMSSIYRAFIALFEQVLLTNSHTYYIRIYRCASQTIIDSIVTQKSKNYV